MKKIFNILIIILLIGSISINVNAKEKIKIYFFHGKDCIHCKKEDENLIKELSKREDVEIEKREVFYNKNNAKLFQKVTQEYKTSSMVPYNVIGDKVIIGYNEERKNEILDAINYYKTHKYVDKIDKIKKSEKVNIVDKIKEKKYIKIPIFGKISTSKTALISTSALIGLVDGFNPCSMWILLFLLATLININDKKKLITLGLIFILTSGFMYFIIMFSWLGLIVNITTSIITRYLIGIFAIVAAIYNFYAYIKTRKDDGCLIVSEKKRKSVFNKIKKYVYNKKMTISIIGIMLLAVSVNVVDLLCSAGLPVIYSEILAINKISGLKSILYTSIYILFFLLDDIIIFMAAVITNNLVGISTKYNKYSHIISFIIMLMLGILLIFKPEIIMLNI